MSTVLHRCRFVDWKPEAIISMDMPPKGYRPILSVVRNNGDLDLYDATQNWHHIQIPTGGSIGRAIESVIWLKRKLPNQADLKECDGNTHGDKNWKFEKGWVMSKEGREKLPLARLITAGHDGNIVEWDLESLRPKKVLNTNGGGIWCMTNSSYKSFLAVACEDGYIRIVDSTTFRIASKLPHHDGKVVSLSWMGDFLTAGTADSHILIYSIKEGRLLHKLKVTDYEGETAIVWCVKMLSDYTVISADSLGQIQFWDSKLGTQIQSYRPIKSPILTLAVHSSGTRLWMSTADGRTLEMQRRGKFPDFRWKSHSNFSHHVHDLRASGCGFIICEGIMKGEKTVNFHEIFYMGGVDGTITMLRTDIVTKVHARKRQITCVPQQGTVKIPKEPRMMAASVNGGISLWTLGIVSKRILEMAEKREAVPKTLPNAQRLSQTGRKLLQMNIPNGESVCSFDISSDGKLLAYCTRSGVRAYYIDLKKGGDENSLEDIDVKKIKFSDDIKADLVQFVKEDRMLLCVGYNSADCVATMNLYSFDDTTTTLKPELKSIKSLANIETPICNISLGSKYLALQELNGKIHILKKNTFELVHSITNFTSAVQFIKIIVGSKDETLLVITADRHIFHQKLPSGKLIPYTLTSDWYEQTEPILGITNQDPTRLRLWSASNIYELDLMNITKSLHCHSGYENILGLEYLAEGEAVLVERPNDHVYSDLPLPQERRKFGGY